MLTDMKPNPNAMGGSPPNRKSSLEVTRRTFVKSSLVVLNRLRQVGALVGAQKLFSQEADNDTGSVDFGNAHLDFDTLPQRRAEVVARLRPLLSPEAKAIVDRNEHELATTNIQKLMMFQVVFDYWLNPPPSTKPSPQQRAAVQARIRAMQTTGFGVEGLLLAAAMGEVRGAPADPKEVARQRSKMMEDLLRAAGVSSGHNFDDAAPLGQARTLMKAVRIITPQKVWPTAALDWYSLDGQNIKPLNEAEPKGFAFLKRLSIDPVTATQGRWDGNLVYGESAHRAENLTKALFGRVNFASSLVDPKTDDTRSLQKLTRGPIEDDSFVFEALGEKGQEWLRRDRDQTRRAAAVLKDVPLWWLTLLY
jgi:hypothetical protein